MSLQAPVRPVEIPIPLGLATPKPEAVMPPSGLVRDEISGHYNKSRERYLYNNWMKHRGKPTFQARVLGFLRDHVNRNIPKLLYRLLLGHDIHTTAFAELFVRHFHFNQSNPFTGKMEYHDVNVDGKVVSRPGWWENVGLVSRGDVTTAFRDFEAAELIAETTEYGDFKFHRPGTDNTAESNAHTALIADAGLEQTGSQVQGASAAAYKSIATVTADATETWEEHSIRSQTGAAAGTMMDRSLISPNVSVNDQDTVEFTYEITKTAEA